MLDLSNPNPAYRLGRLFAVLEKIQEEASPGLNATIRDRYYGAASSTPVAVFTTLLRLKNAHLKKLMPGRVTGFEKLLGEVLGPVTDFPKHLPLPDQGRFALGYYHQRQDFFTKKPDDSTHTTTPTEGTPA
jgi:CRISPR-associated protein Csd1